MEQKEFYKTELKELEEKQNELNLLIKVIRYGYCKHTLNKELETINKRYDMVYERLEDL